ncbi:MAG: hypothetical protein HRU15_02675 [Planctomycetes bacterium]|nr:hypothetical protein [Planctomycetota bacterium]
MLRIIFLCLVMLGMCTQSLDAAEKTGASPELSLKVFHIFTKKCAECHGGHKKKPKGSFGFVLDLQRLSNDDLYITKGDPEDSDLYAYLVSEDEDELMPPADSDITAMTTEEIKTVYDWIAAGAGMGEVHIEVEEPRQASQSDPETVVVEADAQTQAKESHEGPTFSLLKIFAHLHPLVVHFPIALLLVAAFCELLSLRYSAHAQNFHFCLRLCIIIAAASALMSVWTGWVNAGYEGYADKTVWTHRWGGVSVAVVSVLLIILDGLRCKKPDVQKLQLAFRIFLIIVVILVSIVGHTGGELVHDEGYFF